jgi:hypothetical protein
MMLKIIRYIYYLIYQERIITNKNTKHKTLILKHLDYTNSIKSMFLKFF